VQDEPVVEGEKKKLTKQEKKLLYGTASFPEHLAKMRDLLKDLLAPADKTPRSPEMDKMAVEQAEACLCESFAASENPYKDLCDMYDVFSDNKEKYKRVHKVLFKTFEAWVERHGTPDKMEKWLTTEFKKETMEKIVKKGSGNLDTLLRVFQLKGAELAVQVAEKIKDLCSQSKQQFGEAMKLAGHFDLHEQYPIERFVIPHMLQNRGQEALENYLRGHYSITIKLVRFLDMLVNESDQYKMIQVQPYINAKIISEKAAYEFVTTRFTGVLKRIATSDFGIEESSSAPRFHAQKIKKRLTWLLFERTDDGGAFTAKVFDNVKSTIKKGSPMAGEVIIALFDRITRGHEREDKQKYYAEAEMWMLYYELNPSDFYSHIRSYFASNPNWKDRAAKMLKKFAIATTSDLYLDDGKTPIVWIEKWEQMQRMLDDIEALPEDSMIGIDSEFSAVMNTKQQIALLQVSSVDRVYLVDFEKLVSGISQDKMVEFTFRLWGVDHIKIGFDMHSDIQAYCSTIKCCAEDLEKQMTRVVCLKRLANDLLDMDSTLFDLSQSSSYKKREISGKAAPEEEAAHRHRAIKLSDL
ncbi:hypothetical protein PMAYCL1PPCAC_09434, partial [Pristionchus mayeri]